MSLDLVRFATSQGFAWGVVQGDEVSAPVLWQNQPTARPMARSLEDLVQEWTSTPVRSHRLAQLALLAPITSNQQLLFQLGNYSLTALAWRCWPEGTLTQPLSDWVHALPGSALLAPLLLATADIIWLARRTT